MFYRGLLGNLSGKVTFEKRFRGNKGGNHEVESVKNALSKHRGPEMGNCLLNMRNNKE